MFRLLSAALLFAGICGAALRAQTPDTATLQGSILDPADAPVAAAHITATNETTGLVRTTTSDQSGRFSLAGLPAEGAYTVAIEKIGFTSAVESQVQLVAGSGAVLHLALQVAGQNSVVTVEG